MRAKANSNYNTCNLQVVNYYNTAQCFQRKQHSSLNHSANSI